jgi:hypothetical protein
VTAEALVFGWCLLQYRNYSHFIQQGNNNNNNNSAEGIGSS